jgi:outer membrane lipoprotein-sorting protein
LARAIDRSRDDAVARPLTLFGLLLFAVAAVAPAQDIVTAQEFFSKVSAKFGTIKDYSCDFRYDKDDTVSSGKFYYKAPNLIRMDYSSPKGQVVLMDGEKLQILIPSLSLILEQVFTKSTTRVDMGTERALRMLSDGYDIAYLDKPEPVPLEPGSKEQVTKLRLTRRLASEMYREVVLSISKELLIRRWEGKLEDRTSMVMDYSNIRLNQNIPASRFDDEAWPEANVYTDFLTGG